MSTHKFNADVNQVLSLVINSLYSNKEIFLRELVSNASDALNKLRFRAITEPKLLTDAETLEIRLLPDKEAGTLTIWDNGIGMTDTEMVDNLGTVARSGSRAFIEKVKESQGEADFSLIGQFGVGFYSSYLVANRVEVVSRAAGQDKAYKWSSDAGETFTIEETERDEIGTSVILHLKDDQKDYLEAWRLRNLVTKYSDFVGHTIKLQVEKGDEGDKKLELDAINSGRPLWERAPEDVTEEQYHEFYKQLAHDWEPPMAYTHFKIEGTQLFRGVLFVPKRRPFDLFDPDTKHGVSLYVRRVFIMDNAEELLPKWLRFMRGVVDSDDLPLNVSRETLQDSRVVRTIRKQVVKKALDMLESIATDRADDYAQVWDRFGPVLKEGLHFQPEHKDRIAKLLRFQSSHTAEGLVSLDQYKERMKEDQKAIYYVLAPTRTLAEASPHLELLKKHGYEVLYLTDAIDQWAMDSLSEYDETPVVSVTDADLKLDQSEAKEGEDDKKETSKLDSLRERFKEVLEDRVGEVRLSNRLTDSPLCLVIPAGGLPSHIERMLRANHQEFGGTKRILEINGGHPLIAKIDALHNQNRQSQEVAKWIRLLYDQALILEGSPIEDPGLFAARMTEMMQLAVGGADE